MPQATHILRARRRRDARGAGAARARTYAQLAAVVLSLAAGIVVLALAVTFSNLTAALPPVADLERSFGPAGREAFRPAQFYDRQGEHLLFDMLHPAAVDRRWIYLDPNGPIDLPPYTLQALLTALDEDFWDHPGYHPSQAVTAIADYLFWTGGEDSAATITERLALAQLAPLDPGGVHPAATRVQTTLLAAELTRRYAREQILEWYINSADFGNRAYGIDAAALVYFGKHASDLTLAESAVLAPIPAATDINPIDQPGEARLRQRGLLQTMEQTGVINADEARQARQAGMGSGARVETDPGLDSIASYVVERMQADFGRTLLGRSGLRVLTSLDYELHQQVLCALESQIGRLNGAAPGTVVSASGGESCLAAGLLPPVRPRDAGVDHGVDNGAVVILDARTGELLSMTGPATAGASVDGLAAPFIALTALSQGYTPASMLLDLPEEAGSTFISEDEAGHGPVRLRTALANQYPSALARLAHQIGDESLRRTAASFGLAALDRIGTGLQGGPEFEASLVSLSHAFSVFAAEGRLVGSRAGTPGGSERLEPVVLLQIEDAGRRLLYQANPETQALVSAQLAYLMDDMLSDEQARWPSYGRGNPLEAGRPAAVLAAGDADHRQAWTVGFTPQVVVGVWLHTQAQSASQPLTVLNGPAPLWHALLGYALRDEPAASFRAPPGVNSLEVCDPSGLLPTAYCPNIVREVFLDGTEPTTFDNLFQPFLVNRETGKLATLETPLDLVQEQVFMIVPPEAAAWARLAGIERPPEEYDTLRVEDQDPLVVITAPDPFDYLHGEVVIRGRAEPEEMQSFRVQYGRGLNPTSWVQLGEQGAGPVRGGRLAVWDTGSLSGLYTIQLVVVDRSGRLRTDAVLVTLDNQPPQAALTLPEPDAVIVGGVQDSTVLQAQVSDEYGVARVVFYVDGRVATTVTSPPYSTRWTLSTSGEHTVYVEVFDLAGNSIDTPTSTFTVVRP